MLKNTESILLLINNIIDIDVFVIILFQLFQFIKMVHGSPNGQRMRNVSTERERRRLRSKIAAAEKLVSGAPDKEIKPFMAGTTTRCRQNGGKSTKNLVKEYAIVAKITGDGNRLELLAEPKRHSVTVMIQKGPGSTLKIPAVVHNGDTVSVIDCESGWRYKGSEFVRVVRSDGTEGYIQKFHLDVTSDFGGRDSWRQPRQYNDLLPDCKMTRERVIKEGSRAPYKYYSPGSAPLDWVREHVKLSTRSAVTESRYFDPYN